MLGFDKGANDLINPRNAGASTALYVQTAAQQVNEGGMPKIPCDLTEFAGLLMLLAKMRDQRAASQLLKMFHELKFDMNVFKRIINILKYCEEVSYKCTNRTINDDGAQNLPARDGEENNKGHGTFYADNVCGVFRRQVKQRKIGVVMFNPEREERISELTFPSLTTIFYYALQEIEEEVVGII